MNTAWPTEHYYTGQLGKPGVGLYVDASKAVQAREIVIYTQTPGWRVQIWASNSPPDPEAFESGAGGWTQLTQVASVQRKQPISLHTPKTGYRYYLVWITTLPPGRMIVFLNEVALYQLSS